MIDVQASESQSKFAIDSVGVTGLRYPITVRDRGAAPQTQMASWRLGVKLPRDQRGTHMSRFLDELNKQCETPMDLDQFYRFAGQINRRLEAPEAEVAATFEWLRKVQAPVTAQTGYLACEVTYAARVQSDDGQKILTVKAPVTSLCPCSKAISDRGAHNQRSYVTAELTYPASATVATIAEVTRLLEESASAPVFPILKREDEKFVTELAYDNPVFVEDLVRNIADKLFGLPGVIRFEAYALNQESIHDHDCFARITHEH